MKTAPQAMMLLALCLLTAVFGAVFVALPVHAEIVQTDQSTLGDATSGTPEYDLGTGMGGSLTAIAAKFHYTFPTSWAVTNTEVQVVQYSDAAYSTQVGVCAFTTGATIAAGTGDYSTWAYDATHSSGVKCVFSVSNYVKLLFASGGGGGYNVSWYGSPSLPSGWTVVTQGGNTTIQAPYVVTTGLSGGVGSIDWGSLSIPALYSSSSQAIATSSALWASLALASSTQGCSSGNVFADALCSAGTYLFIPNQQILQGFAQLPQTEASHWPFSWILAVQTAFSSQSASSTANLPTYSYDFASVDPASTTPLGHILPSFTFLSSSTVLTYIGQGNWNILQGFIVAVLYLVFGYDVFFTLRNRFHRV